MVTYQCFICLRYRGELKCDAFPAGIPEAMLVGDLDHRKPLPNDNGFLFEPIPDHPLVADLEADDETTPETEDVEKAYSPALARLRGALLHKGFQPDVFEPGGFLCDASPAELLQLFQEAD